MPVSPFDVGEASHGGEVEDFSDQVAMPMLPADLDDGVASVKIDTSAVEGGLAAENRQCSKVGIAAGRRDESVDEGVAEKSSRDRDQHEGRDSELECSRLQCRSTSPVSPVEQVVVDVAKMEPDFQVPTRNPRGDKVFDQNQRECAHYRRRSPPLSKVKTATTPSVPGRALSEKLETLAFRAILAWMQLRPGLLPLFRSIDN